VSLEIRFFYCGNGDTILIRSENDWGLIDCNLTKSSRAKDRILATLADHNVQRLKFVCVTHYDADHLRGMAGLLRDKFSDDAGDSSGRRRWRIEQLIQPLPVRNTARGLALMTESLKTINNSKIDLDFSVDALSFLDLTKRMLQDGATQGDSDRVHMPPYIAPSFLANAPPNAGRTLFGQFEVWFLAPEPSVAEEFEEEKFLPIYARLMKNPKALAKHVTENSLSRVIAFRHIDTGHAILFSADAPTDSWPQIIRRWDECRPIGIGMGDIPRWKNFDVVKVSHHGAIDSHYPILFSDWMNRDKIAVITCLSEDPKHPHPDVLNHLSENGLRVETTGSLNRAQPKPTRGGLPGGRRVNATHEAADICVTLSGNDFTVSRTSV
jgi:beta-lactamase superfamily II metal-dependent hydrolase